MVENPYRNILRDALKMDQEQIQRVTFDSWDGDNQVFIQRGSQSDPDGKSYPIMVPIQGDDDENLLLVQVGSGYVAIGKIIKNTDTYVPMVVVFDKLGTPDDADFPGNPIRGTLAYDATNNYLYVRASSEWRYTPMLFPTLHQITGTRIGPAALTDLLATLDGLGYIDDQSTATPPAVTGSRGGNVALADLLTELETLGIIDDQTTA